MCRQRRRRQPANTRVSTADGEGVGVRPRAQWRIRRRADVRPTTCARRRPSPRTRKFILLAHIASAGAWLGLVIGLLVLGVLLPGDGSKYGLVRYLWVSVRLALNVVLVTLVVFVLSPEVISMDSAARATRTSGAPLPATLDLAFPPVVSTACVLVAMTLSVFKPWGRNPQPPTRCSATLGGVPAAERA